MTDVEVEVYDTADLKKGWWLLLVSGIVSLGIGAMLIFWPGPTLTVLTAIIGILMIVTGIVRFVIAIFDSHAPERWLLVIAGILGIVLGVVVLKNPEATLKIIVLIVAISWLIMGLVDFFRGVTNENLPDRFIRIVFGLVSALFGLVVLVWPDVTLGVFAVMTGLYAAFIGVLEIVAALKIKNA